MIQRNTMNKALSLALALSLTTLAGCSALPGSSSGDQPTGTTAQAQGGLRVRVEWDGFRTQAGITPSQVRVNLKLRFPSLDNMEIPRLNLSDQEAATFDGLPIAEAILTAEAVLKDTGEILDKQTKVITIRPGVVSEIPLAMVLGGSAASDLTLGFSPDTRAPSSFFNNEDGYQWDFNQGSFGYRTMRFLYTKGAATASHVVKHEGYRATRAIDNGDPEEIPVESFVNLPSHARYVDHVETMGQYKRLRHFQWTNTYGSHTYTIDRWINGAQGLIKETLSEGGTLISSLMRDEGRLVATTQMNGVASLLPGNLDLRRLNGSSYERFSIGYSRSDDSYSFDGLPPGRYQVAYDSHEPNDSGSPLISAGSMVSEAFDVTTDKEATANLDLAWDVAPGIRDNATYAVGTDAFTFGPRSNPVADEYQVMVFSQNQAPIWSSEWSTTRSFTWNGNGGFETNTPMGPYPGSGKHYYAIKFRKVGTTIGGEGYYGSTRLIPFNVKRDGAPQP